MTEIGYALSSEEHDPNALVSFARRAEEAGFSFALISDHYHPWVPSQGQSPFVWGVLGAIAGATERLRLGTGVTCPIRRIHPAIIAQAAATASLLLPGRFFLGVGAGEHLNEHIFGDAWPTAPERHEMLEEAIEVIRALWSGETTTHVGKHFRVDEARVFTRPESPPPISVAAGGPEAAELAGRAGDGLIGTTADAELLAAFAKEGGRKKPRYGQMSVCVAADEKRARRVAHRWWPTAGLKGRDKVMWEVKTPELFEEIVANVCEEDVAESILCGADPDAHLEKIREYADAGYDHVYVHQVGPDQEAFFRLYERSVLPKLA
jgi:G6PDH family F420-dependent oxidoreductase